MLLSLSGCRRPATADSRAQGSLPTGTVGPATADSRAALPRGLWAQAISSAAVENPGLDKPSPT